MGLDLGGEIIGLFVDLRRGGMEDMEFLVLSQLPDGSIVAGNEAGGVRVVDRLSPDAEVDFDTIIGIAERLRTLRAA